MMRLQRGLVRSGTAFDVMGTVGAASILGLILALVFAAAAAGTLDGRVESDVAAPSSTRAAGAGVVTSGLGGRAGEGGESTRVSSADVGGAADMPDQRGLRGIQGGDGVEESSRSRDLTGSRKVHDPFGGVDPVANEIGPRLEVDRLLDRSEMEAGAQAVRRKARSARGPAE